jgi:phosphoglucosamine mutase
MHELPQVLTNVKVATKDGWDTNADIEAAVTNGKRLLGPRGRVLVRPSGTEPLIRVMVEAPTASEATDIASTIADAVTKAQG